MGLGTSPQLTQPPIAPGERVTGGEKLSEGVYEKMIIERKVYRGEKEENMKE